VRRLALLVLLLPGLALPASAHAAFPGKDGKIAFTHRANGKYDIWVMNADGSGKTQLTDSTQDLVGSSEPAWSAAGARIAFVRDYSIWTMNADGGGKGEVIANDSSGSALDPAWSPDGSKIVFVRVHCIYDPQYDCNSKLHVANADGTGDTEVNTGSLSPVVPAWSPDGGSIVYEGVTGDLVFVIGRDLYTIDPDGSHPTRLTYTNADEAYFTPDWSPDGARLVFARTGDPSLGIYLMNRDGSGQTSISSVGSVGVSWSPDQTKIAFDHSPGGAAGGSEVYVMNPNGSGVTQLTNDPASDVYSYQPDWQPLPINSFPRPKGATPVFTSLTVAYKPCTSGNRTHGPPLAADSCSPPVQTSDYLTVGTLDANGQKANATAWVGQRTIVGNPSTPADEADVKLTASLSDVRQKDLSDYPGELQIQTTRRMTDKDNTPAPNGGTGAATVRDLRFSATVPCGTTSDTTIGSLCSLDTTADTLVPGSVKEGMRSIWELSQVLLYDGGSDGQASTTSDNTLFMDEGIFVP
jgi:Tol biopolymer transport system component